MLQDLPSHRKPHSAITPVSRSLLSLFLHPRRRDPFHLKGCCERSEIVHNGRSTFRETGVREVPDPV